MSIFTRKRNTAARRLGGEGWDLTPSAADKLPGAQIEIVDDPKREAATESPPPAADTKGQADNKIGQDHPVPAGSNC